MVKIKETKFITKVEPKLDQIIDQPGIDLILSASLALNAARARRKRIYLFNRRSQEQKKHFNFSQQFLRISFILMIGVSLTLASIMVVVIAQALIDSNYECILSPTLEFTKDDDNHRIEIDPSSRSESQANCLFSFRFITHKYKLCFVEILIYLVI
jgi:hypothetical protein